MRDVENIDFISNYIIFFVIWFHQKISKDYEKELNVLRTDEKKFFKKDIRYLIKLFENDDEDFEEKRKKKMRRKQMNTLKKLIDLDTNERLNILELEINKQVKRSKRIKKLQNNNIQKILNKIQKNEMKSEIKKILEEMNIINNNNDEMDNQIDEIDLETVPSEMDLETIPSEEDEIKHSNEKQSQTNENETNQNETKENEKQTQTNENTEEENYVTCKTMNKLFRIYLNKFIKLLRHRDLYSRLALTHEEEMVEGKEFDKIIERKFKNIIKNNKKLIDNDNLFDLSKLEVEKTKKSNQEKKQNCETDNSLNKIETDKKYEQNNTSDKVQENQTETNKQNEQNNTPDKMEENQTETDKQNEQNTISNKIQEINKKYEQNNTSDKVQENQTEIDKQNEQNNLSNQSQEPQTDKRMKQYFKILFKSLFYYLMSHTEILVIFGFTLNYLVNRNILSAFFPICGYALVLLSPSPYPSKDIWKLLQKFYILIICVRFIFQFPGWCLTSNQEKTFDYITFSMKNRYVYNSKVQCSSQPLTNNPLSAIYLFGVYPVDIFIFSSFVWDVICLFLISVHMRIMRINGYWNQEYIIKKELAETIIENQRRRKLAENNLEPFSETYCLVRTTRKNPTKSQNYISFNKHDIYIARKVNDDGDVVIEKIDDICQNLKKPQENNEKLIKSSHLKYYPFRLFITKKDDKKMKKNEEKGYSKDIVLNFREKMKTVLKEEETNYKKKQESEYKIKINGKKNNQMNNSIQNPNEQQTKIKKEKSKLENFVNNTEKGLKMYFSHLCSNNWKVGANYYAPQFVCDIIFTVFMIVCSPFFIDSESNFISYFSKESYLPLTYAIGVIFQFLFIIIDHIIYIKKSLKHKVVFHYFTIIWYNITFVLFYPLKEKQFNTLAVVSLTLCYFLKSNYWFFSCLQIRNGYALHASFDYKRDKSKYSLITSWIYETWYSIPYVYEIKTLLEWTYTKTSLTRQKWLQIQDIKEQLFINQSENQHDKDMKKKPGTKQRPITLCCCGHCKIIFFICLLSFPLLFMSSAFSFFNAMEPTSFDIQINLADSGEMFAQYKTNHSRLSYEDIKYLNDHVIQSNEMKIDTDVVLYEMKVPLHSLHYWFVSPYNKRLLREMLCSKENNQVQLEILIKMSREESAAENEFSYHDKRSLSSEEKNGLCNITSGLSINKDFRLELFPKYFRMPSLHETDLEAYSNKISPVKVFPIVENDPSLGLSYWMFSDNGKIETSIYVESPEVPKQIFGLSKITELGILTIYTAIVFVIYSYFKTDYEGVSHSIIFENMPNCKKLLRLCDDIEIARQSGDLKLEEELADELLEIYRSPEMIKYYTSNKKSDDQNEKTTKKEELHPKQD